MPGLSVADLVSAYADRFNPVVLASARAGEAVSSPLGAWLLLALAAPATSGARRRDLEAVLGTDAADAADRARRLLADPHPAIAAACAVWDRRLGAAFADWAATLPETVARGPIPDQRSADEWARSHTYGLVERFPLPLDAATPLVLASALATDVAWNAPLAVTTELGGPFGTAAHRALGFRDGIHLVADTEAAGPVAVAAPRSTSALEVLSVTAAPDVPAPDVDRAAHQVAALLRGDGREARLVAPESLTDGHAWTVVERYEPRIAASEPAIVWESLVPAWSMTGTHDLIGAPGLDVVAATLADFAAPQDRPVELAARQTATATYGRTGFRAAAVTAVGVRATSMRPQREVLVRRITLRFNRPHAVLACAARDAGPQAWRGVPVFSAWVAAPQEVPDAP